MNDKIDDSSRRALLSSVLSTDGFEPAAALVQVDIGARSDHGRVFNENDDHFIVLRLGRYQETLITSLISLDVPRRFDEYAYVALVADGIGSGGAGAMAARLAISTLRAPRTPLRTMGHANRPRDRVRDHGSLPMVIPAHP
jgi:hypothetical protein